MSIRTKVTTTIGVLAAALLAMPGAARAQSASINGSIGNFDVANNQGVDAHGFEVELEGVHPEDIASTFNTERYGAPTITPTSTGTIVRWAAAYDPASGFTAATAPHDPGGALAGECYLWAGALYDTSGCEHFGVSLSVNAVRTTYRWLVTDPADPTTLTPGPEPIAIAAPAYSVAAATVAGGNPILNADVDAPPGDFPTHYGDAFWLKVFRTQTTRSVALDELTNDNPSVVPENAAQIETSWTLIQADPLIKFTAGNGNRSRARARNAGPMPGDTGAVVRRYEVYEYTGKYDAVFRQALCAVSNCASPAAGEVGALLSAQMTAANVVVPSISVTRTGAGSVASVDRLLSCGSTCAAAYSIGATATLVAAPSSGNIFAGWSGACAGTAPSCRLVVNEHLTVGAAFAAEASGTTTAAKPVTLSIGISNKGTVTTADGSIACPGACSAKLTSGSTVTVSASPTIAPFVGWSGACSGTNPTCTFTITKDSQVQATFAK